MAIAKSKTPVRTRTKVNPFTKQRTKASTTRAAIEAAKRALEHQPARRKMAPPSRHDVVALGHLLHLIFTWLSTHSHEIAEVLAKAGIEFGLGKGLDKLPPLHGGIKITLRKTGRVGDKQYLLEYGITNNTSAVVYPRRVAFPKFVEVLVGQEPKLPPRVSPDDTETFAAVVTTSAPEKSGHVTVHFEEEKTASGKLAFRQSEP